MVDTKISALTAASAAAGANELAINEAGASKKLTVTQIQTLINASRHFDIPTLIIGQRSGITATTYQIGYESIYFDKSKYTGFTGIYFAADLSNAAAGTFTIYCKLYDQTAGSDTSMPELSAALSQYSHNMAISADIQAVIASGANLYASEIKVQSGGNASVSGIRLIVRF